MKQSFEDNLDLDLSYPLPGIGRFRVNVFALRAALREDPDIILVGEMRDLETISLAITAAETGHLVFATLHTNSALKAIDRVVDVFPEGQQMQIRVMLSESLRGVVAQTLLPRADHQGRVPVVEVLINVPRWLI
jgi:twitching motility protein PilT